jgi:hypothetical protein
MTTSRINLSDTFMTAMIKMSDGNPGAITALMDLSIEKPTVDPESAMGALAPLLSLDTHQIYGSAIWILYKDVCKQDARTMLMLLRAVQLGLFSESALQRLSQEDRSETITDEKMTELDMQVCAQLEQFQRPTKATGE